MTDLGPTREARQHDVYEAPERSQKKNRTAYRRLPEWERDHKLGTLEDEHFLVCLEYEVAWHGRDGRDVRREQGGVRRDPDYPAQQQFADKLHHAKNYVRDKETWDLVEEYVMLETPLAVLGQRFTKSKTNAIRRAYAASRVTRGLDLIAQAWGIAQHARSRERAAA